MTLAEAQAAFRGLPPIDVDEWNRERAEDDLVFGADDPTEDPWERRRTSASENRAVTGS